MKNRCNVPINRRASCRAGYILAVGGALTLLSSASDADEAPNGRTLGFVLSNFSPAMYLGKDDCPQGLALSLRDAYVASRTPAERARLLRPENADELQKAYMVDFVFGADGSNTCQNPEKYPRGPQRMVQGKIARGMNLDGKISPEDFTSPDGESGVDNALYKAVGCSLYYRGLDENFGDAIRQIDKYLSNGEQTTLLILKGVDDMRDDREVEVVIASSDDIPPLDSAQRIIPNGSLTVTENHAWRHVARGSIKDGVLTSEPIDFSLNGRVGLANGLLAKRDVREFHQARFRLKLSDDGSSISGIMGAYRTIAQARQIQFHAGSAAATFQGIECAGEYWAMVEAADGLPDATTGKFTGLSVAYDVKGVPAYIFDRPGEKQPLASVQSKSR